MSDLPHPSSVPSSPVDSAGKRALIEDRLDKDAVIAALVAVLLLHMLAVWLTPRHAPVPEPFRSPEQQNVRLELLPPPLEVEDDPQFMRANPDAPIEVPQDTQNYSHRDQVAAQEEAAPLSEDNMPMLDGDREDSNRIVQGSPYEQAPMPAAQAGQDSAEEATQLEAAPDRNPVWTPPEAMDAEPEADEGLLSVVDPLDNPEIPEEPTEDNELNPVEQRSPADGRGEAQTTAQAQQPSPQMREPRPDRPTLRDNSFGPLLRTFTGVSRTGRISIDTRYSEFGAYWNRVLEAIERQWNNLVYNNQRSIQFNGSEVTIEFLISRDGSVTNVRVVQSSVGRLPETLAIDAIRSPAPFPDWTPEMIAQMGTSTVKRITFIY